MEDEKDVDIKNVSSGLDVGEVSFSQMMSDRSTPLPVFSSLSAEALEDLANSIHAQGIIQPIVIRETGHQKYEIIAGERRWRAAKIVGLKNVPCLIKNVEDDAAIAIALIENIQREDLNVMEEAHAFERLLNEFSMTHEAIAQAVGKSRVSISNLLRLLRLDPTVQMWLENGDLTMGHGRALLGLSLEGQVSTAQQVIEKSLSVRQTEALVKAIQSGHSHQQQGGCLHLPAAFPRN